MKFYIGLPTSLGSTKYRDYRDEPTPGERSALQQPSPYHDPMSTRRLAQTKSTRRKYTLIGVFVVIIALAAVGAVLGIELSNRKRSNSSSSSNGNGNSGSNTNSDPGNGGSGSSSTTATSGKTGSRITMEDGTTFVYTNDFGGDWAFDPKQPFAPGGKAQDWSPRVGQDSWVFGSDIIRGVNLGYVSDFSG